MQLKRKIAAGLALAALPFAFGQGVASADSTSTKHGTLTFVSTTGVQTTCTFDASSTHNTTANPDKVFATSKSGCRGSMTIVATYKNEAGATNESDAFAGSTRDLQLTAFHAVSSVSVQHSVTFSGCSTTMNPTCSLTLQTAPK